MNFIDMINNDIKALLIRKKYKKNNTIVFAQKENNYVYFLIEGIAEAYILSPNGVFTSLYLYKKNDFFGEIEQFYDGAKPVEITAVTDCVVDILHKDDFLNWLENDFEATKLLIKEISHKLIINANLVEEVISLTIKERLLRCIAIHYHKNTLDKLTKNQICKEINAPIRSLNRVINECIKEKIIIYENKKFSILNEKLINKYIPLY